MCVYKQYNMWFITTRICSLWNTSFSDTIWGSAWTKSLFRQELFIFSFIPSLVWRRGRETACKVHQGSAQQSSKHLWQAWHFTSIGTVTTLSTHTLKSCTQMHAHTSSHAPSTGSRTHTHTPANYQTSPDCRWCVVFLLESSGRGPDRRWWSRMF